MGLLEKIERQRLLQQKEATSEIVKNIDRRFDIHEDLKAKIHQKIIDEINKQKIEIRGREISAEIFNFIEGIVSSEAEDINVLERNKLSEAILDEIVGYGPLEVLLRDSTVSEIMVNGPHKVYVEKDGKLQLSEVRFKDNEHVMNIIDRIVSSVGRHIDESSPMVDARLYDGSRVNAIIPPLSLSGPVITIRKFSKTPITVEQLLEFGSLSQKMVSFLEACVKGKLNIIVSGGTGSGKTTLLNVLSSFIPANERIITIEDAAELQLMQEHVITLESRPANLEDKGQITIRQLVKNSLRMRPDRIIVGEVRSSETMDMLQAMNTGHDGSLTTIHANSPRDSLSRIETMILMTGMELPLRAIREQVSSAIDLIVQQSRLRDGTRKVIYITEVNGMEDDTIIMQDIFKYETSGELDSKGKFKGRFISSGVRPYCLEKLINSGVKVNYDWFRSE
ncbi:MAG: CpaF family protein [Desulfosporosinus sp.]|jgi:pilus assembly protein CpaF